MKDIFTLLIWLTLFTSCYVTYTCHGFPYERSSKTNHMFGQDLVKSWQIKLTIDFSKRN